MLHMSDRLSEQHTHMSVVQLIENVSSAPLMDDKAEMTEKTQLMRDR